MKLDLSTRDALWIVGAAVACLAVSTVSVRLALAGCLAVVLVVQLVEFRGLRQAQRLTLDGLERERRDRERDYRQIEQLFSLFSLVKVKEPLPAMRGWAVSPDFATLVVSAVRERRPNIVVEFGAGVSTLITGYCLTALGQGRLTSIEHDEAYAAQARDEIARHGLGRVVTVVHAPLADVAIEGRTYRWYELPELRDPIDLLIVDGPPATEDTHARYPAVPLLIDRLYDGALILVDDGSREGEREIVSRWAERFPMLTVEFKETEKGAYLLRVRRAARAGLPPAAGRTGPAQPVA